MFDRFVVTHFVPETGVGYARQLTSGRGELTAEPILFRADRPSDVYYEASEHEFGFRGASTATAARRPEIDEEIVGCLARKTVPSLPLERNVNGLPLLRNWAYADQDEAVRMDVADAEADEPEDELDPADVAEYEHGRVHEMYNN